MYWRTERADLAFEGYIKYVRVVARAVRRNTDVLVNKKMSDFMSNDLMKGFRILASRNSGWTELVTKHECFVRGMQIANVHLFSKTKERTIFSQHMIAATDVKTYASLLSVGGDV